MVSCCFDGGNVIPACSSMADKGKGTCIVNQHYHLNQLEMETCYLDVKSRGEKIEISIWVGGGMTASILYISSCKYTAAVVLHFMHRE